MESLEVCLKKISKRFRRGNFIGISVGILDEKNAGIAGVTFEGISENNGEGNLDRFHGEISNGIPLMEEYLEKLQQISLGVFPEDIF